MDLELAAGARLPGVLVLSSHIRRNVRQMDRLDVLLHVLLDLRVLVIIQAAVIELLLLLRHLENHVL